MNSGNYYTKTETDDRISEFIEQHIPDNITTQGNEFNTGNNLVKLINGKISNNLLNFTIPVIITNFNYPNHETIPTTLAVSNFVDNKINEINIPDTSSFITIDTNNLTNYYNKVECDNKYALKSQLNNYFSKTKYDNRYALKSDIPEIPEDLNNKLTTVWVSGKYNLLNEGTQYSSYEYIFDCDFTLTNEQLIKARGEVNLFWKDESEAMSLGYNNGDQIFYWCFIAKCMDSDNTESFFPKLEIYNDVNTNQTKARFFAPSNYFLIINKKNGQYKSYVKPNNYFQIQIRIFY